ncbi:MAG TPA: cytochrome c3 family protein [Vicinamibacterales bacterium]|nr:cytochrome c3 family protein [Vicinamibacterales bacterium]
MTRLIRFLLLGAIVAFVGAFSISVHAQAQPKEPGVVILKGNPQGGVKFDHPKHSKVAKDCDVCHHAPKPEMTAKAKQQKCQDCHTKTVKPPMKTNARAAFHDAMAKKGLCVDCHADQGKAGKKVPVKCAECHQKANT